MSELDEKSIENAEEKSKCSSIKNRMKKVIKYILTGIVIAALYVVTVEAGTRIYIHWLENMKYTKYELSIEEQMDLRNYFAVGIKEYFADPSIFFPLNKYSKEKKNYNLESSIYTDAQVEQFNKLLFDSSAEDARKVALKYGITESNPATSDWVVTHPKEALEIVYADDKMEELYNEELKELLWDYY